MAKKVWLLTLIIAVVIAIGIGLYLMSIPHEVEIAEVRQAGLGLMAPKSCSDVFAVNITVQNVTSLYCGIVTLKLEGPLGVVGVENGRVGGSEVYVTGWQLKSPSEMMILFEAPRTKAVNGSGNLFSIILAPQGTGQAKVLISSISYALLTSTNDGRYIPNIITSTPDINITIKLTGVASATTAKPGSLKIKAISSETPESIDPPIYPLTYGDVDGDLDIDLNDLNTLRKRLCQGRLNLSDMADACHDGKIDLLDLSQLKLILWRKEARLTLKDMAGRVVTIPQPVKRIVSCAILDTPRTLLALRAGNLVVGIDFYTHKYGLERTDYYDVLPYVARVYNWSKLPVVGTYKEPNVELIKSLNPDVIFAYARASDVADALQKAIGIPVVCNYYYCPMLGEKPKNLVNFTGWKLIATVIGKDELAENLIAYAREKVEWLRNQTRDIPLSERPKVYYAYAGPRGFEWTAPHYESIDLAGGRNVASGCGSSSVVQVSKEQIIAWDPDIILVHSRSFTGRSSFPARLQEILSDPALQQISAVKNGTIYPLPAEMIGWDPAQAICEAYYLAKLFHPDKFKDLDVEAECNEVLKTIYGVDGLWSIWMDMVRQYLLPEAR